MIEKDEYLVYTADGGTMYYYKNKKLHREAGPAILVPSINLQHSSLGDEYLYKKVFNPVIEEEIDHDIVFLGDGTKVILDNFPSYYFISYYYLEGINLTESHFNKIMLKKKMEKELSKKEIEFKQFKI